jgi:pimeloyl-ACP methyl ester carboxylesterase
VLNDLIYLPVGALAEAGSDAVKPYLEQAAQLTIIAGKDDPIVPTVNGQFLADRLPNKRYMLLDAGHRYWEEAAYKYVETLVSRFGGDYHSLEKTSR